MKKKQIAFVGAAMLGILALVAVARGTGSGVAAAEDERFKMNGSTLVRYLGTDTFVSIPDTVKSIGDEAFSGNETMTSIEIPDSVTSIAYNAFKNCTALTGVSIPDTVKKVGPGAFEGCKELTSVTIGEGVSSWGTGVFTNCDSLAKVSIDNDNEYLTYYNGAIYNGNMTMLYQVLPGREGENYVMPETVKTIDAYAFWNLIHTKNVKVSSKVSSIPKYAMSNMGSVENAVLQNTTTIEENAFANNTTLKQVAIPASVTQIDKSAFKGSPNIKIFTGKSSTADIFGSNNNIEVIYKAEYPDDFMDSNPDLEEKPNVGEPLEGTQETPETSKTTPVTEGQTEDENNTEQSTEVETAEQSSSSGFVSTEGYIHPLDVPEKDNVIGKTVVASGNAVFLIDNHKEKVYGIPDGVQADVVSGDVSDTKEDAEVKDSISVDYKKEEEDTNSIPQREYYKQKKLTSYEIPETIKKIGRLAFAESGLKSIQIPDTVTEIEYGAFMSCKDLAEVTIPDTVSYIGTKAFDKTAWLNNWKEEKSDNDEDDFLIVGDGILLAYKGNKEHVEIPDKVKQIGAEVFKGHTEILDVSVPASVQKICAEAFRNCSELTGLTGCEGLKTVVRGAFYGTQISESEFK